MHKSNQPTSKSQSSPLVFVWETFGPMHMDRCIAASERFGATRKVVGIQLSELSDTYNWKPAPPSNFELITLFEKESISEISNLKLGWRLLQACRASGGSDFFLCHYELPSIFLASIVLRIFGKRVYAMNDSKFDDKPRYVLRELFKSLLYKPYNGAIVGSRRTSEYLKFLSFSDHQVVRGYDTISVMRIRQESGAPPAPAGMDFKHRHFTVIARLVPKKNLFVLLEAYALYIRTHNQPTLLHICGDGPLAEELEHKTEELGLSNYVTFHGQVDSTSVSRIFGKTLALLLISTEEQFGLVIPEALAMGVPVIASRNCGACDELVRSGLNGFVVEPDDTNQIVHFMTVLSTDSQTWKRMAREAEKSAFLGDAVHFANACEELINRTTQQ